MQNKNKYLWFGEYRGEVDREGCRWIDPTLSSFLEEGRLLGEGKGMGNWYKTTRVNVPTGVLITFALRENLG